MVLIIPNNNNYSNSNSNNNNNSRFFKTNNLHNTNSVAEQQSKRVNAQTLTPTNRRFLESLGYHVVRSSVQRLPRTKI